MNTWNTPCWKDIFCICFFFFVFFFCIVYCFNFSNPSSRVFKTITFYDLYKRCGLSKICWKYSYSVMLERYYLHWICHFHCECWHYVLVAMVTWIRIFFCKIDFGVDNQVLVNNMCINNQFDPLLKGDNLLLICYFFVKSDVDWTKCVYIIHISVCRSKIVCLEIAVFLSNLWRSNSSVAMETKMINILRLFHSWHL